MLSEILKKLKRAERRLETLHKELQALESEKRVYIQKIMKGEQLTTEVKKADQAMTRKSLVISNAKEKVGNLRAETERQLAKFRKDWIDEKQKEVNDHIKKRTLYLERIKELEVEISKFRYLITGKKDHHLVDLDDLSLPKTDQREALVPIDEVIGRIKVAISRIHSMSSEELLKEYLARVKQNERNR